MFLAPVFVSGSEPVDRDPHVMFSRGPPAVLVRRGGGDAPSTGAGWKEEQLCDIRAMPSDCAGCQEEALCDICPEPRSPKPRPGLNSVEGPLPVAFFKSVGAAPVPLPGM